MVTTRADRPTPQPTDRPSSQAGAGHRPKSRPIHSAKTGPASIRSKLRHRCREAHVAQGGGVDPLGHARRRPVLAAGSSGAGAEEREPPFTPCGAGPGAGEVGIDAWHSRCHRGGLAASLPSARLGAFISGLAFCRLGVRRAGLRLQSPVHSQTICRCRSSRGAIAVGGRGTPPTGKKERCASS